MGCPRNPVGDVSSGSTSDKPMQEIDLASGLIDFWRIIHPLDLSGTTLRRSELTPRCRVDRQAITDDLERTERQLVEVAARIQKQKAVLARLEAAGENTAYPGAPLIRSDRLLRCHLRPLETRTKSKGPSW